ncbi:uncharacterized protein B4U80_12807 [Leptotrombidium deliense]|uniref:Ras-GEF domain-containing protein n=1 Tax=Leptotrombidium deliense TaxID=299467 RepID=A0A443SL12_9ACAR|nr:uncharacterized protein B4U80_12807 [Leptotrombidium deliense]
MIMPMMSDDRQSSTSEVSNYSSLSSSVSASSAVSASRSSFGYGSLKETAAASNASGNRSATPVSKQIQRFGEGCKDNCLLPLYLPVTDTKFLKGRSTWASLLIAAEEALIQWEDAAKYRKKTVNRVLDEVSFISPLSALESETLLSPNCKLPLRRYCSNIDLRKFRKDRKCKQSNLRRRKSLLEFDEIASLENVENLPKDKQSKNDSSVNEIEEQTMNEKNTFLMKTFRSMRSARSVGNHKKVEENRQKSVTPKSRAKSLISTMKLNNPISVGIQLTNIDKELFSKLTAVEVFQVVIGKEKSLSNNKLNGIETLIAFREEVKRMVINVITKETTTELQSRKMAAFIEVACVLRKLRNWNSLECVIKALQSPHIYVLEKAWSHTATTYPIHFGDYLKLVKFVRSCDQHLIRTTESQPSIPSLTSFVNTFKVQCSAKYDLIVCERRWTEADNLVGNYN